MNTINYLGYECVSLKNDFVTLLVTKSVGPRVISLCLHDEDNLFAELQDFTVEHPEGEVFHFYGGHRLWHAPESMPRTYVPDNDPVNIVATENGLLINQAVEAGTGIEKSLNIILEENKPRIIVQHVLTNKGLWPVETAPWAITQFRPGGVAILPQSQHPTGFLPNRSLVLWPYTDINNPNLKLGNNHILLDAKMQEGAIKIGFPNRRGWLAYQLKNVLFVKRVNFDERAEYFDCNSSSACYCNKRFLELETLAPKGILAPGESVTHTETWELYRDIEKVQNEESVKALIESLGLDK